MTFEPTSHQVAFVLPSSFAKGEVIFYSLSLGEEVKIAITPNGQPRYTLSTRSLGKGLWRAMLCWSDGKNRFQEEKQFLIN